MPLLHSVSSWELAYFGLNVSQNKSLKKTKTKIKIDLSRSKLHVSGNVSQCRGKGLRQPSSVAVPQTVWFKHRNVSLNSAGGRLAEWVLGEGSVFHPGCLLVTFHCSGLGRERGCCLWCPSGEGANPVCQGSSFTTSKLNYCLEPCLQIWSYS